jgi:PKD repeat protein
MVSKALFLGFVFAALIAPASVAAQALHAPHFVLPDKPEVEHEAHWVNPYATTGSCGVERWSVKVGTDPDVHLVNPLSPTTQTISYLRSLAAPATLPANNRVSPTEDTSFVINATLVGYKLESDSDYHLVIQDASGNTMIVEVPDPACVASTSPFYTYIENSRSQFDAKYSPTTSFKTVSIPVRILGVGFFDFLHGQTGVAPNGIELHPVLDIVFNPSTGNVPPVANFSYSTNGLIATFTDSSTDSDGTVASHAWTFGDGSTSTAASPSHTYAAGGTYSVAETVKDNLGAANTKTVSVTVSGTTGGTVLTNGVAVTGLSAATGTYLKYTMVVPAGATNLTFTQSGGTGDSDMYVKFGSAPTDTVYDCRPYVSGNAETCTFATPQAGTYYVNLKAYAAFSGVSLVGSYTAGTTNTAPTANFTSSVSGLTATFTDSSTDPQGNATITGHAWNFGDGGTSTATSPSHTYAAAATYTVTETVTDNGGLTGSKSAAVTAIAGGTPQQLFGNTGFENGSSNPSPWTVTSGVVSNSTTEPTHAGTWDAWLDGYGTAHTDTVSQTVTIPASDTVANLGFWLHVDTNETSTTNAYDTLKVEVFDSSGTLLGVAAQYSNLDAATGYKQHTVDLRAYVGKTITVKFIGTEGASLLTSFVLDDVTLNVQ